MGNINISDLRPAGADLFLDSESYLNDLTEGEMINIGGGLDWSLILCSLFLCGAAVAVNEPQAQVQHETVRNQRVAFALAVG